MIDEEAHGHDVGKDAMKQTDENIVERPNVAAV